MIDDLEDGDNLIREVDGRSGRWEMVNDSTDGAMQNPADDASIATEDGAQGTSWSARTWGGGFTGWGSGLQVYVNGTGALPCSYDASPYVGISFHAKGTGRVRVAVATSPTIPVESGGTCATGCYNYHYTTIDLTDSWVLHEIAWTDLEQLGWGERIDFSPAEISYIAFEFRADVDFDIYVDELSFH